MEYGLYPFWFWNGLEGEEEIRRQLYLFSEAGCKGVVIHARTGNRVAYLSPRWMELIRFACDECGAIGLKIWLYDEEDYPSGNAGGRVQAGRPDLEQKCLVFRYGPYDPSEPLAAAYDASTYEAVGAGYPAGAEVLKFEVRHLPQLVDVFHPESCQRFLALTHEAYKEAVGDYFGTVIEAIYTDDESFLGCRVDALPWSEWLVARYEEETGEAIGSILPLLVENLPGCEEARFRFYKTALGLFLERFIDPQRRWAEENGLAFLGHLCCDEGPASSAIKAFTAAMPYLRHETIPSIDDFLIDLDDQRYLCHLVNAGRHFLTPSDGDDAARAPLLLYKQGSSIAHQFARNAFSCECLTYLGWDRSPAYLDRQMAFEIAMGVNLMTPHAFYYTIGGVAKHDCPPSYFFQQPWSRMAAPFFKRCTEAAQLLGRGRYHASTLLPYPAAFASALDGSGVSASFPCRLPATEGYSLAEQERGFAATVRELCRRHVGFDFLDEHLLDDARVEDGYLIIGEMRYGTVLLPPVISLLPETKHLLCAFALSGGKVLFPEETHVPLADIVLTGTGADEILVQARDLEGDITEFFLVNMGAATARISARFPGPLVVYDPVSRKIVHRGTSFPPGFSLPPGAGVHLLSPDCPAPEIPFLKSPFSSFRIPVEPDFLGGRALNRNILRVPDTDEVFFDLVPGAIVRMVYAEEMADTIEVSGGSYGPQLRRSHHPCDPCYEGRAIGDLVQPGPNVVRLPEKRPMVAIGGRFRLREGGVLAPDQPLELGDITRQGYPYYWGEVEYRFSFSGVKSLVHLRFAGGGSAEVFVNGTLCGTVANDAIPVYVGDAVRDGENELVVVYAGIAENFITGRIVPAGLLSVRCS